MSLFWTKHGQDVVKYVLLARAWAVLPRTAANEYQYPGLENEKNDLQVCVGAKTTLSKQTYGFAKFDEDSTSRAIALSSEAFAAILILLVKLKSFVGVRWAMRKLAWKSFQMLTMCRVTSRF